MAESHTNLTERKEDLYRCEKVLDTLISASEKYRVTEAQQTLDGWRSKLKDLKLKLDNPPKTKIAVYGDTGQGKSSLLNALFDQPDLLPTGGYGSACTSVITKIETVDKRPDGSDKEGFQADIIFISKEEWEKEIEVLMNDMVDDDFDPDEVKQRAETKLTAVYREIEDLNTVIQQRTDITEKLEKGHLTTAIFDSASDLQDEIEDYMTETKNEKQYWPIVQCISMRLFNSQIPGQGIVFIDLPGVADANPVRVKIAEDEKQSAKVLLVLAGIERCLSNPTLKSIVGDKMYCEMEMDQQENIIVCTHSDNIPELRRAKKHITEDEWNEVKELDTSIKESKKTIAELEKQKLLKMQCKKQEESLLIRCGNFRNNSVKKDLSKSTNSEVFCVSSTDYMKIAKEEYQGDRKPSTFKERDETEIPQLRDFLQNKAFQQRVKELELIQQQFHSVISDTYAYLLNFQIGGKEQSQEKVSEELKNMRKSLQEIRPSLNLAVTKMYKDQLFPSVHEGVEAAVNSALETSSKWGLSSGGRKSSQTDKTGLLFNTYKATLVRNGYFMRKNGSSIDFNSDLAYPLTTKIVKPWMEVFREETWEELIKSEVKVPAQGIIEKYSRQIQDVLQDRTDEELGSNLLRIKEDALVKLERLTVFEEKIEQAQRQAHRLIALTVEEKMTPTYQQCAEQKKRGSFEKMKEIMKTHVEEKKGDIFQWTGKELKHRLKNIKEEACDYVKVYLLGIHDDYKQQMDPLWMNQVEQEFLGSQEIEKAKKDLLDMQLKNDKSQDNSGQGEKRLGTGLDAREVPEKKSKIGDIPPAGNGRKGKLKQNKLSQSQNQGPSGDSAACSSTQTKSKITESGDCDLGSQMDRGQLQGQSLTQQVDRSSGTNYGKAVPDMEPVPVMRLLVKTAQSIGLIGSNGTGFKVGSNFIMTARHVFALAFGWAERHFESDCEFVKTVNTRLTDEDLFISFHDCSIERKFKIKMVGYANSHLDVAVAQLEGNSSCIPSLSNFVDTEHRKVTFHFIGHNNAGQVQFRDPNCTTVTQEEAQKCKTAIMRLFEQDKTREVDLSKYDIMGNSKEFLHFKCCFKEGASGSPGLMVAGKKVKVLTMLICGYPKGKYIQNTRSELCVEEGVRMKAIKDDMKKVDMNLCKEIFKGYSDHDTLWYV